MSTLIIQTQFSKKAQRLPNYKPHPTLLSIHKKNEPSGEKSPNKKEMPLVMPRQFDELMEWGFYAEATLAGWATIGKKNMSRTKIKCSGPAPLADNDQPREERYLRGRTFCNKTSFR